MRPYPFRCLPLSLLLWILAILAPALPALAGAGVWTPLGPDRASVTALAVDPARPHIVYAGTRRSGLFKSVDGGATWVFAGRGLGVPEVTALAIDPTAPQTVYAATNGSGVFRSTDGGASWSKIWNGVPSPFTPSGATYALAVDPKRPSTLYAGTDAGFYRSTNGGATWSRSGSFGTVLALAVDAPGGWLYAGDFGQGVFKSFDRGKTWAPVNAGLPDPRRIRSLAIDPERPKTLLAATADFGIYRSLDRGQSWQAAAGSQQFNGVAVVFQRRGRAFAAVNDVLFRSTDAGATWQQAPIPFPIRFTLTSLAAGPAAVYAGGVGALTGDGGVFRSLDAGLSWASSCDGLHGPPIAPVAIDPSDSRTLFAVWSGFRLARSRDGGGTWAELYSSSSLFGISDILLDPARPGRVYVTNGYPDPILRSDDGGDTWEVLRVGLELRDIALDPRTPDSLWGVDRFGAPLSLYHSANGGESWQLIWSFPADITFLEHVEVDPHDPSVVYVGGVQELANQQPRFVPRLFRTADGGATWERRDAGLNGGSVKDIAVDTTDPSVLYAVTDRLYVSTDTGVSWSTGGGPNYLSASVVTLPTGPSTPAAVCSARPNVPAVLCSTDQGETWTIHRQGLGAYTPLVLEADPNDPAQLYLGTFNGGLMTYTLGDQR